ncbi:MAG: potassium-transporting ATPase subunit KdpC [Sphingobacteriales bacterium]|nr:potassium-transporting ATPase subunit KdpC [Sphingobacteriales bacterium]
MKNYLWTSVKLTIVMILICCVLYFGIVGLIGKMTPGEGGGQKLSVNGKSVGYALIGQKFTDDKYFWGRPSAVDYNAAGSGGSNKGPSNPDYLKIVQERIDSFLAHNPGVTKDAIPAEMVTASGSGLDPHISPASAYIQVKRIAGIRKLEEKQLKVLIAQHIEQSFAGPEILNVLKLNIALDKLAK